MACSRVQFTFKFIIIIIVNIIVIIIIIIISVSNFDVTLILNICIRLLKNESGFKSRVCVGHVIHRHGVKPNYEGKFICVNSMNVYGGEVEV